MPWMRAPHAVKRLQAEVDRLQTDMEKLRRDHEAILRTAGRFYEAGWDDALKDLDAQESRRHLKVMRLTT